MYLSSYRFSVAAAHDWINSSIFPRTSWLTAAGPTACKRDTRLSMNSREAISTRKWEPPFLTQVSVNCPSMLVAPFSFLQSCRRCSYVERAQLGIGVLVAYALLQGAHGLLGLDCLGSDDIRYLEVEWDVLPERQGAVSQSKSYRSLCWNTILQAAAGCFIDLFVQGGIGRGRPPTSHHLARAPRPGALRPKD